MAQAHSRVTVENCSIQHLLHIRGVTTEVCLSKSMHQVIMEDRPSWWQSFWYAWHTHWIYTAPYSSDVYAEPIMKIHTTIFPSVCSTVIHINWNVFGFGTCLSDKWKSKFPNTFRYEFKLKYLSKKKKKYFLSFDQTKCTFTPPKTWSQ